MSKMFDVAQISGLDLFLHAQLWEEASLLLYQLSDTGNSIMPSFSWTTTQPPFYGHYTSQPVLAGTFS